MAVLRAKEAAKLDKKGRQAKLKDLKLELVKSGVSATKTKTRTKEIKKAIARLLTFAAVERKEQKRTK